MTNQYRLDKGMREMVEAAFTKKSKIFKDKSTLKPSYVPEFLPERKKELEKIIWELRDCQEGIAPNNIFIYGKTGVGKTACTKRALQLLNVKLKELNIKNIRTMYLNCVTAHSECKVVGKMANFFSKKLVAPKTGWPTEDYYDLFTRTLDGLSGIFIVILDEIDKLVPGSEDLLYNLSSANEHLLSNAELSLIGISNDLKFTEYLDPRILSRLRQHEIIIPPYNGIQLKKILMQRTKLAFHNVIGEGTLGLCAAFAAREHGDARKALDLLKTAGEIAEKEGAKKVTQKHVHYAQSKIEVDKMKEVINTLPKQSKLLLLSIVFNEQYNKKNTTAEIYDTYKDLAKTTQTNIVTQKRISDLISELDMLGIVATRVVSRGRYGKTREVSSTLPKSALPNLFSDETLPDLKNYRPKKKFFYKRSGWWQ